MLAFPPDLTFVIQLVSFFVLLFVLNGLLFAPFGALLAERTRRTRGVREQAAKVHAESEALASTITRALEEARDSARAQADAIRREARARETETLNAAKRTAAERLSTLRVAIAQERDRATKTLRDEAAGLAQSMVDSVLGRKDAGAGR